MFCPTCGAQSSDQSRFCRSCGINLGLISEALSGKLINPREVEIDKAYQKALFRGTVFVLVLIMVGLGVMFFTSTNMSQEEFGWGIGTLIWVTVAPLLANMFFARYKRKIRRQLLEKEWGVASRTKETSRLPELEPVPPPSVTEHTTTPLSQGIPSEERRREHE